MENSKFNETVESIISSIKKSWSGIIRSLAAPEALLQQFPRNCSTGQIHM